MWPLPEAVDDARLGEVVGRHFELHAVTIGEADETLAHLAGDVGQDAVFVCEFDAEHGPGEHGGDFAFGFNNVIHCHKKYTAAPRGPVRKGAAMALSPG